MSARRRVVVIQGGGTGYDQEAAARRVLGAAGVDLDWQPFEAGHASLARGGEALPGAMLEAVCEAGLALKTRLFTAPGTGGENYNVTLRRRLGLHAAERPIHTLAGLPSRFEGIDILLVREITEDLYAAAEHEIVPGVVQSIKVVTEAACRRFFRFAFELARRHGRRTVHCIHKANILKLADGLFLQCFREVARDFPEIQPREMIVDNCCMQLVSAPRQFDVMVAGNLYGDLLSDLGAGLAGGTSTAVGINHGEGLRVYEAIHGEPRGGADRASPLALLLAAAALVRDLGHGATARRLVAAIETVLVEGRVRTPDLGGSARTSEMAEAIIASLGAGPA